MGILSACDRSNHELWHTVVYLQDYVSETVAGCDTLLDYFIKLFMGKNDGGIINFDFLERSFLLSIDSWL